MPASHKTPAHVLNALNMSALAPVEGFGTAAFQIQGTFTGTITFEASVQGAEFQPFRVTKSDNSTAVTTTTTTGIYSGSVAGYASVRARMSSYSDGGASVIILAAPPSGGGAGGGGGSGTDVNLIEVGGASIALGEAVMAASLPVVIASDQTPIPITGSISASNPSVGPTGDPVPAEATLMGVSDANGDLAALASVAADYNSTSPPVVPVSMLGIALPGAGGPVAGGTNANPIQIGDAGGAITVDGTVTANAGTNLNTSALALEATLSTLNGKVTAVNTGAVVIASGTVTAVTSITNPVTVAQATAANLNATVVGTGTFVTQVSTVNGQSADDAAIAGLPLRIAGASKSPDGTDPGSVSAENETANVITDLNRRVYVNTDHPRSLTVHLDGSSAYTDQALIADPGDGFQAVITNIIASTGAATALNFFLEEGSTKIFGPIYLEAVAGRGFCSGPIYLPCTASTAVTLTSSAAIAQSFQVNYFVQAV